MSFALISVNFIHVGDCWKNGFEHNNIAIFKLKLHWVPQSFFGGSTWECVLLHEEMKIIYLVAQKPLRSELEIASKHHPLKMVTKGLSLWKSLCPTSDGNKTFKGYKYTHLVVGFGPQGAPQFCGRGRT